MIGCPSCPAIAGPSEATTNEKSEYFSNSQFTHSQSIWQSGIAYTNISAGWIESNNATKCVPDECRWHSNAIDARLRYAHTSNAKTTVSTKSNGTVTGRNNRFGGAGTICENVQTTTNQIRLHPR